MCVQNAGRSQMATAFAEATRESEDDVEILTGGTRPADHVHDVVVEVMAERGFDLSDRTPREVTRKELRDADLVVTMGCSATDVCPATWNGENRDWDLDDPDDATVEEAREIRDEIADRVDDLFAELRASA